MSAHAKKEAAAKNPPSLANLRHAIAGQPDPAPRKTVSHEAFQKTIQTSTASSNSGGGIIGGTAPAGDPLSATDLGSKNISASSGSSGGVSAFSYLKARLFGSVADASTSARDLLQSKKGSDQTKGSSPEPSFGGNSGANRNKANSSEGPQAIDSGPGTSLAPPTTAVSHAEPPLSPMTATQHPSSTHRFFSRTLPSRRQPQPDPLQLDLATQGRPAPPASPSFTLASDGKSVLPTASPNSLLAPMPTQTAQPTDQGQLRPFVGSHPNAHKHLSTSSLIFLDGYLNKKVELHSGETGHGWKVYKVVLKSSKLYFYKPVSTDDRPQFQGPKDHHRHYLISNHAHRDQQGYHHPQHSSSSGILSPRLSIANESGMVLSAYNFESSTRTLLFEGNAKSLSQGAQAFAPPVTKYVYGECFTEIDRLTMQFKKHVALLLFGDSVVICKRKWVRYTSTKVKDAIKFSSATHEKGDVQETVSGKRQGSMSGISYKSGDSRSSEGEHKGRGSFDIPSEKQRGYFTKWKHEATYPLSQVEALDMASPVPSSSATFYPFAAPATAAAAGNHSDIGRNSRDSNVSSIYTNASLPSHTYQTTSTLELVITSNIDGKEYTQRLLYLPPSQEIRHQWYSKFNRVKEMYQAQSRTASKGRGSVESLVLKDTLSPRSAHSNHSTHSTISFQPPKSPTMYTEAGNIILNSRKMDRLRAFCETTTHPELTLQLDDFTGKERLSGASINGLLHELVHGNTTKGHLDLVYVFATTYPLFTTVSHTIKELRRCICLENTGTANSNPEGMLRRVEALIQEMVQRINIRSADSNSLEAIRAFTQDILLGKLNSTAADAILNSIDSALHDQGDVFEEPLVDSLIQSSLSGEASVDLSNVLITGLTPALFLKLKPSYFAEQVLRYHCEQLRMAGDIVMLLSNPAYFMRQYPTAGTSRSQQSSLVFSMCSPHFLTVLITHHILIATQSVQSTSRRPKLLAQWIRTAQHSRALGDLAGFMAIAIGICSPGVVRLQETWKQVPQELRLEVAQNWVPLLIKMDMITEDLQELAISSFDLKPSLSSVIDLSLESGNVVVPCVSNIKQSIDQLDRAMSSFIQSSPVPLLNIEKLEHIHAILSKAKQSLPDTLSVERAASTWPDNAHLQQYFDHLASISQTLHDQYHSNELSNDAFESSLACEPHFNGQYLDYHYKNRKMTGSFIPLIFPEAIPEKRLFPLPLLLSLENTGNTYRKSSFDDAQTFEPSSTSRSTLAKQASGLPSGTTHGPGEWIDSSATHHGMTNLGLSGSSPYPRSRKRTYSFPPARSATHSAGTSGIQPMVNMTNPHLDAVASGCLHSSEDPESNEVFVAMKKVAGIGYNLISIEGDNLVLKVREENLETLMKAVMQEEDEDGHTADLQKMAPLWNTGTGLEPSRSRLSVVTGPRPAMVNAGTLDNLIHVVVMGLEDQSGKYTDEKGDMISWASRQLTLDHESYMKAFFATYRSFCTPSRLLEQLVTMFTFAQQSIPTSNSNMPSGLDLFTEPQKISSNPTRASTGSRSSSTFEWKKILAMQLNVLRALEYWLKVHVSDFLDDLSLKAKLSEALKRMSAQEEMQKQLISESYPSGANALAEKLNDVTRLAVQLSMTPLDALSLESDTLETFFGHHPSMTPQLDDACSAEQILDQMNTAAWAHFISVREQEWFLLFEIVESQSADPLGWYLPRSNATPADEDILITNIHNTLFSIRRNGAPGTHWNGERLMSSLPLCLQNLCKLHHVVRGWVISQIASPSITYDVRLDRVQKMLDIILLSRQQMSRFGDDSAKSPHSRTSEPQSQQLSGTGVPSFVEKAIVSALVSPESRAYTRVWLELGRGSVETLEDVLAAQREREIVPQGAAVSTADLKLVPGIGWLIERMLETCCYVRDMSYESPQLINFDKRQYVYDLVQVYVRCQGQMREMRIAPTQLSSWLGQSSGPSSNLSMRVIREAAQREAQSQRGSSTGQLSSASNNSGKSSRPVKIFSQLVALQQEKLKRDQREFEKLEKQIKDTQGRIQKAQQEQAKNLEKQIKLEQSRSRVKNQLLKSTLMRAMRPISLAITSSWSTATTTVSNATALGSAISGKVMGGTAGAGGVADALGSHQLNIQPRSTSLTGSVYSLTSPKPALVINLINSTCSVAYTYTKRDFVFKIVTEEGGQSLLQALDYDDMLKWIKILNEAAAEATAKRRTLLDSEEALKNVLELTGQVDEIPIAVENERKSRNSVFGVELRHLMSDGNIPLVVEKCIAEIEKRGLEEVGIYRVPGAVSAINRLRISFNSGSQNVDLDSDEWKDINVVAGALKQFLRELPEAVMTSALYDSLIAASALADYDERLLMMRDLIRTLPPPNYLLLKRIIEHLERVTDYEEINHMYATNLAIVFGPTLLRAGGTSASSFATSMKNLGHQQNIIRNMILQYHWLFDVEDEEGGEEAEEEEEGGLGEFPEILEDSDEEEEEEDNDDHEYEGEEIEDGGVKRTGTGRDVSDQDDVLVLMASQETATGIGPKKVEEKNTKKQHRKTIVFG